MIGFRLAFDLWSGSEAMGVFRFLAPLLAPLFVLADEGARWLWGGRARAVIATAVLLSLAFNANGHRSLVERRARYADGLANAHMALGAWLRERHPEGTLVAIGDAGVVPFFSRLPVIDLWGLNDATIAQMPGEYGARAGVAEYALARRPGVIVLWNQVPYLGTPGQGQMLGAQRFDRAINDHPSFKASYRFVEEFTFRAQAGRRLGYYLDVFERKSGSGLRSRKGRRER
jgi:hypothetical protein